MTVGRSLLVFFAVQTALVAAESVQLSIHRRSPPAVQDAAYYARSAERLRLRYASVPDDFSTSKRAIDLSARAEVPLLNQALDTEYLATVSIGSPAQNLTLLLDTASADLWVVSNLCTTCASETPKFDRTRSSTFQFANNAQLPYVNLSYPAGSVQGSAAQDTVGMGGLSVSSQTLLVSNRTISGFLGTNASGIMGLAFSPVSRTGSVPFWQNLFNSNQLTQPLMSFWLTRYVNVTGARPYEYGGELTLGGTNSTLYTGDIEYQNLASNPPDYWSLQLTGLTLGGNAIAVATPALTIFDIGAKYIAGPKDDVKAFWQAVPNSQPLAGGLLGYYSFPCDTKVQAAFSFGGASWSVDPADINLGSLGAGRCMGAIHELGDQIGSARWVMGETFMKNVYSVFRVSPPSIGFARLSALGSRPPSSTPPHQRTSTPMGLIIGAIAAGVISFVFALIALLLFIRRRKRLAGSTVPHKLHETEKFTALDSRNYELTPFASGGQNDTWSQRSSQPTFHPPWIPSSREPGNMTPETLTTDDRAADDIYGLPSPIRMSFRSSTEVTNMPLLPRPVVTTTGLRNSALEPSSSGEVSPVASPGPDQLNTRNDSFGPQDMQRIRDSIQQPTTRGFQLRDPPVPSIPTTRPQTQFEEFNIYTDFNRLMGDPMPADGSGSSAGPAPPAKE